MSNSNERPLGAKITGFRISNVDGDGININGQNNVEISNGVIRGARGNGITISNVNGATLRNLHIDGRPENLDQASDALMEAIRNLSQKDIDELRVLLGNSKTSQEKISVLSTTTIAEALFEKGIRIIDVADKIARLIDRLG
jgi:hypothetical protein